MMYLFCSNPNVVFDARSLRDFAKPFGRITRFEFAGGWPTRRNNRCEDGHSIVEWETRHSGQRSLSARSLFPVAPPVDRLNIFRMVVSPCSSHTAGTNMVGHDV